MRCTVARPTPVPSKSSDLCRRWNTPNNLSAYFMLNPTPLSRTKTTEFSFSCCWPISMTAEDRGRLYFKALERRFCVTCLINEGSHSTKGSFVDLPLHLPAFAFRFQIR